jgi:thiamine-phosphate pyrophosphorylase
MPGPRLYLIAPPILTDEALATLAALIRDFDIACVRLQPATMVEAEIRRAADALKALCRPAEVDLVLANHFRLVGPLGLDGVHLTDGARSVREARRVLGGEAIVGACARASRHEGMTAAEIGADYVGFGPVSHTPLGDGSVAPPELFEWWAEMIEVPVVAEGGVTPELAATLARSADFLALGEELWSHSDGPAAALAALTARLPPD